MSEAGYMDIHKVMGQLPHRFPFLLVDRVLQCKPGESLTAIKNVTINEPYFQGHFPGYPVMPGVLVLEALIQLSTLLAANSGERVPGTVRSMDSVRFKRQVIPGDLLLLETTMEPGGKFTVRASVDGETATEGTIVLAPDAP